jgi:nucleotide-binding universal stress UspA family protein
MTEHILADASRIPRSDSAAAPTPFGEAKAPIAAGRARGPIVLGTEFGPVSAAAERVAIRQALRDGVPLIIVNAIDPGRLRLPGGRYYQRVDQARAARQAAAVSLLERVRAAGVEPQLLIWDGDPATCVVEAAQAEGASRIVVGSHGRGRIGRAIAGSVSAEIVEMANCPVDIVRDDDGTEEIVSVTRRP